MGIEPFLIASSLLGVVGQRLVRRICEHCVEPYTPTPDERSFYERGGGDPTRPTSSHGVGCNFCGHTGYFDRIGVYEVLARHRRDEGAHRHRRAARASCATLAIEQGMTTLRDQAIRLVDREQDHHRRGAPHRVRALAG